MMINSAIIISTGYSHYNIGTVMSINYDKHTTEIINWKEKHVSLSSLIISDAWANLSNSQSDSGENITAGQW